MISKDRRLSKSEIVGVKDNSQKSKTKHFFILYKKNDLNKIKIAVVVSKKVAPKAVDRNSLKREIINIISPKLVTYDNSSLNLIIYPQKSFILLSPADKKQILTETLNQLCQ